MIKSNTNFARTGAKLSAALAVALTASGCGLSSLTSGLGGGLFGASSAKPAEGSAVSAEGLLTAAKAENGAAAGVGADVAHGCPRFNVWTRDGNVTIYEAGRVGDGLAVMHRGEITKTARECSVQGGKVVVKYGFSGRVLLGPKGKSGTVQLPLVIFVTDAKREKVANDRVRVDVPVALENPIGYFSSVREVSFTVPEGARAGEYEVYVGFDRNIPGSG